MEEKEHGFFLKNGLCIKSVAGNFPNTNTFFQIFEHCTMLYYTDFLEDIFMWTKHVIRLCEKLRILSFHF